MQTNGPSRPSPTDVYNRASLESEQSISSDQLSEMLIQYVKFTPEGHPAFDNHLSLWQRNITTYQYPKILLKLMSQVSTVELTSEIFKQFMDDVPKGALVALLDSTDKKDVHIPEQHYEYLESVLDQKTKEIDLQNTKHMIRPETPDSGIDIN